MGELNIMHARTMYSYSINLHSAVQFSLIISNGDSFCDVPMYCEVGDYEGARTLGAPPTMPHIATPDADPLPNAGRLRRHVGCTGSKFARADGGELHPGSLSERSSVWHHADRHGTILAITGPEHRRSESISTMEKPL